MKYENKPYRSILYVPVSNKKACQKAKKLPVDALILDLEDSVLPDKKSFARDYLHKILTDERSDFGDKKLIVRTNSLKTECGMKDLAKVLEVKPDSILIPKVEGSEDLEQIECNQVFMESKMTIWIMIETPLGVLNVQNTVADSQFLEGIVVGTNDLVNELGAKESLARHSVVGSLAHILLVSRAYGLICVDGVYNAYKDQIGLRTVCEQGREMGFDGKTLIHPSQIEPINTIFSPSSRDIEEARQIIEIFKISKLKGEGVAVLNGKIIEGLHVAAAEKLLGVAKTIEKVKVN